MDPVNQSKQRLLRLASHNKLPDEPNNSNFNVILGNEITAVASEWGGITGISFESVGFPNTFRNVFAPNLRVLFRTTNPGTDTYATPGENLIVTAVGVPDVQRLMVIPPCPDSATLAAAITAQSLNLFPELGYNENWFNASVSPLDGCIHITSRGLTTLISPAWSTIVGVPLAQTQAGPQNEWFAYPLDPTNFREVFVDPGFYDNIQLGNAVAAALQASVGPVVAFSEVSPGFDYRYQVTSTTPIQLVVQQLPLYLHADPRQLLQQMGFFGLPNVVSDGSGIGPNPLIVASALPQLFGETVAYLHSIFLARDCRGFDGEGKIEHHVTTLPIDVPYLGYQNVLLNQYQNPTIKYANPMTLTQVDLRLRNIYGEILDIGPNQELYAVVRLWYER